MVRKSLLLVITICSAFFVADATGQEKKKTPYQENQLSALFNPAVMNDLELGDDQREEVNEILDDIKSYRNELVAELKEFSNSGATKQEVEERQKEIREQLEKRKSDCLSRVEETLLPFQLKRLRQSTAQVMMTEFAKHQKVESGLLTSQMMEYLEIDKEQAKEIRETAKALREELTQEIKKLNEEATKKLMKKLTSDQRKKYEELIGDKLKGR